MTVPTYSQALSALTCSPATFARQNKATQFLIATCRDSSYLALQELEASLVGYKNPTPSTAVALVMVRVELSTR